MDRRNACSVLSDSFSQRQDVADTLNNVAEYRFAVKSRTRGVAGDLSDVAEILRRDVRRRRNVAKCTKEVGSKRSNVTNDLCDVRWHRSAESSEPSVVADIARNVAVCYKSVA